jgi:hypothetical protein
MILAHLASVGLSGIELFGKRRLHPSKVGFVKRNSLVDLAVSVNDRDIRRKNGVGKKE